MQSWAGDALSGAAKTQGVRTIFRYDERIVRKLSDEKIYLY